MINFPDYNGELQIVPNILDPVFAYAGAFDLADAFHVVETHEAKAMAYGACLSALFSTVWPAWETSLPAPAMVLQPLNRSAAPESANNMRANNFVRLRMAMSS
jgi:hypothetical protein